MKKAATNASSPVFVATFASGDGAIVTRMTVYTPEGLNLVRGVRLARAAYESRKKQSAPAILEAHFERNGEIIESYTREQLDTAP